MSRQEKRLEHFKALCEEWFGEVPSENGHYESTAEEDAAEYLYNQERNPLARLCLVAAGGENVYLYPDASEWDHLPKLIEEKIDPGSFSEGVVCVVDLDTGERHDPVWSSLRWAKV